MSSANISAKEASIIIAVIENNNSTLNVDWAYVAAVTGLKNGNTASTRFSQIKKKLGLTGTTVNGAGVIGNRVAKPRTPAKPRSPSGGRKDSPTKGATPTRVRKIKATAKSYKLDTIEEEEEEEAITDYYEEAEEISMVEQVARGDFADDADDLGFDGIVVQGDSPEKVAAGAGIAPKSQAESILTGSIIAEYDFDDGDFSRYDDDEIAALRHALYN